MVSDDPQAIRAALVRLRAEMDVIVATGGLGPDRGRPHRRRRGRAARPSGRTADETVARCDEEAVLDARLRDDAQQPAPGARSPTGRRRCPTRPGSRPASWSRWAAREAFFLPGVPREMEKMFDGRGDAAPGAPLTERGGPRAGDAHLAPLRHGRVAHRSPAGRDPDGRRGRDAALPHREPGEPRQAGGARAADGRGARDRRARRRRAAQAHRPRHLRRRRRDLPAARWRKALRAQEATLAFAESCTGGLAGELVTVGAGGVALLPRRASSPTPTR